MRKLLEDSSLEGLSLEDSSLEGLSREGSSLEGHHWENRHWRIDDSGGPSLEGRSTMEVHHH